MKNSEIYEFYYVGVTDQLRALVKSQVITYVRDQHRYIVSNSAIFSDVMRVTLKRISVELRTKHKVLSRAGQTCEWFFKLLLDDGNNGFLSRLLLTNFSPICNSPLTLYYLSICICRFETCDADSMVFASSQVRFNNVLKMLNGMSDQPISKAATKTLSQMFGVDYLFSTIPSRQTFNKNINKGEIFWLTEAFAPKSLEVNHSTFLESECFKPWACTAVEKLIRDPKLSLTEHEFVMNCFFLIFEHIEVEGSDGRFDHWGVGVVQMGIQYFVMSAVNNKIYGFVDLPEVVRRKSLDFSPIFESNDEFINKAKVVFGEITF